MARLQTKLVQKQKQQEKESYRKKADLKKGKKKQQKTDSRKRGIEETFVSETVVRKEAPVKVKPRAPSDYTSVKAQTDLIAGKLLRQANKKGDASLFHIAPERNIRDVIKEAARENKKRKLEEKEAELEAVKPLMFNKTHYDDMWDGSKVYRDRQNNEVTEIKKPPQFHYYPALPLPLPGQSYHPEDSAHQSALRKKVKDHKRILRLENGWADSLNEEGQRKKDVEFYPIVKEQKVAEDSEEEQEPTILPKKTPRKPHLGPKKRAAELKSKIKAHRSKGAVRLREQLGKLDTITKDVVDITQNREAAAVQKEANKHITPTASIGSTPRPEEPEIPVYLTEQLPGSMAHVSSIHNPIREVWESLDRRNLHEHRYTKMRGWNLHKGVKKYDVFVPTFRKVLKDKGKLNSTDLA